MRNKKNIHEESNVIVVPNLIRIIKLALDQEKELYMQTKAIASLSVITFVLSIVLCLALLPAAPEWEALALAGSLLVTVSLGAGTLMATHHAPLPLFALILNIKETTAKVLRIVSNILNVSLPSTQVSSKFI
ncbi:hypothetical protein SFRURICE_002593 [Spodoptera frugiperda]|nr:hypothetical protein SFRURICE_002593 [Spodoptera frugiperda]